MLLRLMRLEMARMLGGRREAVRIFAARAVLLPGRARHLFGCLPGPAAQAEWRIGSTLFWQTREHSPAKMAAIDAACLRKPHPAFPDFVIAGVGIEAVSVGDGHGA